MARPEEILDSLCGSVLGLILDRIGKTKVIAVILSGSAAEGRISAFDNNGAWEIFSDLDIYAVVEENIDLEKAKRDIKAAVNELISMEKDALFFAPPDIGIFSRKSLLAQPVRPGTVQLAAHHRILYGDSSVLGDRQKFEAPKIAPVESLYLLENRLLESRLLSLELEPTDSIPLARFAYYHGLKSCLDAACVPLILQGKFTPEHEDRMEAFSSMDLTSWIDSARDFEDMVDKARMRIKDLQSSMNEDREQLDAFRRRTAGILLKVWKAAAVSIFGPNQWGKLISRRGRGPSSVSDLREIRLIAKRLGGGPEKWFTAWLRSPSLSPLASLRLSGVCAELTNRHPEVLSKDSGLLKFENYIDHVSRVFGRDKGDVFDRGAYLYKQLN